MLQQKMDCNLINKKISAIVDMPQPTDEKSLQRLLGMTKYLSLYILNESSITAPLRELLKKMRNENGPNITIKRYKSSKQP